MTPQPVYSVRCTARGCDWSVLSNVSGQLRMYWQAHAKWHADQDKG